MIEDKAPISVELDVRQGGYLIFAVPLVIAAVVFSAYSVVLSSNFGVLDDYVFLLNAIVGNNDTVTLLIGAGRPLNAILLNFGFSSAGSVENLSFLRGVTLVGIWLLGCGVFYFSRLHRISLIPSLAIACGIILLPSFQVYASWAQHFTTPFAGALALLSAYILTPVCSLHKRSRPLAVIFSALLLLISILVYQPIAMLFCTGILISLIVSSNFKLAWRPSRLIDSAIAFGAAMLVGYLILKLGQYNFPSGSSRYGLVQNIDEKLKWFFSEPLANAFSLFSIRTNVIVIAGVLLVVLAGALSLFKKRDAYTAFLVLIFGFLCLIGSYIPNLATAENWASYRSTGALGASVVVLFVLMCREVFDYVKSKIDVPQDSRLAKFNKYYWLAPSVLLVILSIQAQSNVLNGFVFPNVTEINNLASALQRMKVQNSATVVLNIRPSSWTDSASRPMAYDEFGMPSSVNDNYAKTLVQIVLISMKTAANTVIASTEKPLAGPLADRDVIFTVNFPDLVTSQRFKTDILFFREKDPTAIYPLEINDGNWKNGIWKNGKRPGTYSFVYRPTNGHQNLKPGDKLNFKQSGTRNVLRVDVTDEYINVLVDGDPISTDEGFPYAIKRLIEP